MSPEALQSFIAVGIGFALAGALVSRLPGLRAAAGGLSDCWRRAQAPQAFAAVPFLVFAAPFIIMRNTVRGRRIEKRRFEFVMLATMLAGFWSMMSGTFFVMLLQAAGLLELTQSSAVDRERSTGQSAAVAVRLVMLDKGAAHDPDTLAFYDREAVKYAARAKARRATSGSKPSWAASPRARKFSSSAAAAGRIPRR